MTLVSLGVAKHDSREWMAYWNYNSLNRYVSVYLSEGAEVLGLQMSYDVEVWAGADNDQRYVRQPVSTFRTLQSHLEEEGEVLFQRLENDLDIAKKRAEAFTMGNLSETYLTPRGLQ